MGKAIGPEEIFQSTLPIREETACTSCGCRPARYFNPLFPYGKRPGCSPSRTMTNAFQSTLPIREETGTKLCNYQVAIISIHSSHTGRDGGRADQRHSCTYFNPLFPYGKRRDQNFRVVLLMISIHSSHTGRDMLPSPIGGTQCDFNPLFPYGKRRERQLAQQQERIFQSTLPIREETWFGSSPWAHAPPFQSTLPIREETGRPPRVIALGTISIHSSHTGRDSRAALGDSVCHHFNPLFPYGKRRSDCSARRKANTFQSTLPIREETLWRP